MTATPVRYEKRDGNEADTPDLAGLRARAKELGISSFGLGRQALKASIAAVENALANAGTSSLPDDASDLELRADELGEALGPNNLKRIPMGTRATRLNGTLRPGYYRRWFNDVPGRIERARRAGYEHVKDGSGSPLSTPAGTQEHGGGMRAYFMEIPDDLRKEDLAQKSAVNDDIDRMLNRGKIDDHKEDRRYVPDAGISIRRR
jgi:hypothetical protein